MTTDVRGEHLTLEDFRALHHTEPVTLPSWEDSAVLIPWASSVAAIAACERIDNHENGNRAALTTSARSTIVTP